MELRDVLLILHIASAGSWLGANLIQGVAPSLAIAQGSQAAAGWFRVSSQLSRKLYMPLSFVILLTGVWLVLLNDGYSFGSIFVTVGFLMILIGALLGVFVFKPGGLAAADAAEAGDDDRLRSTLARVSRIGVLDTVLLIVTIGFMVLRVT